MTQSNDTIAVTPGIGSDVATHTPVGGTKEYQVVMVADVSGHIAGSKPCFFWHIPSQVHANQANTVHWDMFNTHATLIARVVSVLQIPNVTTAVTGVVFDWQLMRTSAIGTGGTVLTAWGGDLTQALDAAITARSKPTGGATASTILRSYSISSEETSAATLQIAAQGGLELVPEPLRNPPLPIGVVLRQNQGMRCVQVTNSNAGNTGWLVGFTLE